MTYSKHPCIQNGHDQQVVMNIDTLIAVTDNSHITKERLNQAGLRLTVNNTGRFTHGANSSYDE